MSDDRAAIVEGVIVPGLQSVVSGGLSAGAVISAGVVFGWSQPLAAGGLVLAAVTLIGWLYFRNEWAARVDPHPVPAPQPAERQYAAETVNHKILTTWDEGRAGVWVEMTGTEMERFCQFAQAILTGISFSENFWCGEGALFSKTEYYRILRKLLERNMIERISEKRNSSYRISGPGGGLFRYAARLYQEQTQLPYPVSEGWTKIIRNRTVSDLREHERV